LKVVVVECGGGSFYLCVKIKINVYDGMEIFQLNEPLDAEDERNFLFIKTMKSDESPVFYRDHVVDKLIRVCMKDGRKELSRSNVYAALEIIKRRQYKAWLNAKDDEEKSKIELDPFVIARKAIRNCHPLMKLRGVTRGEPSFLIIPNFTLTFDRFACFFPTVILYLNSN
uniref:28S ribosomal protein S7, mitochondrial (inferred by orthology to a C. elegans protein) n=1 Tax=Anisakis simplex TaxID=6269 RepID=A0A0M3JCF4_ANISI